MNRPGMLLCWGHCDIFFYKNVPEMFGTPEMLA